MEYAQPILDAGAGLFLASADSAVTGLGVAWVIVFAVFFVIPMLAASRKARWIALALVAANEVRGLMTVGAFLGWLS